MKSMIRIVGLATMVATALVVTAPSADASCPLPKILSSYGDSFSYLVPPAGTLDANWAGSKFWQTGAFATANSGTTQMVGQPGGVGFIKFDPVYSVWYISGDLSQQGIVGCPSGSISMLLQTNTGGEARFHVRTGVSDASGNFRLNSGGDWPLVLMPRPRVVSSSRTGSTVNLQLNLDAATPGVTGLPVGLAYQVVTASSATDPGRNASAFTGGTTITPGTPVPLPSDCANVAADNWVATRLVIDGVPTDLVSNPTRVECDPALADPKFKHIDRPAKPRSDRGNR